MIARRRVLKAGVAAAVGAMAAQVRRLGDPFQLAASAASTGELYAGLVLLADPEAPVPAFVRRPTIPASPTAENPLGASPPNASVKVFDPERDLLGGLHPYRLHMDSLSESAEVATHVSGKVMELQLRYTSAGTRDPAIVLTLRPTYPHPFPVWPWLGASGVAAPEKVSWLPRPGVLIAVIGLEHGLWVDTDGLWMASVGRELATGGLRAVAPLIRRAV